MVLVAALSIATQVWASDLPNPSMTPGAIDPGITQNNIQATICVKGYTKTVRPPAYYTNKLKKRQMRAYGYQDLNPKHYEEDHLIPLSIGGDPRDPRNLWPEPRKSEWGASRKDQLEYYLYKKVCSGEILLDTARKEIAENWIETYKKYGLHRSKKYRKVD